MPVEMNMHFQAGGALYPDAYYVQRGADVELPAALLRGEFCYVLAPRQIGKSSLSIRTAQYLESHGIRCASIDLGATSVRGSSASDWYFDLTKMLTSDLDLRSADATWQANTVGSPVQRWTR